MMQIEVSPCLTPIVDFAEGYHAVTRRDHKDPLGADLDKHYSKQSRE